VIRNDTRFDKLKNVKKKNYFRETVMLILLDFDYKEVLKGQEKKNIYFPVSVLDQSLK